MQASITFIMAETGIWDKTINYEIVTGNALWRFGLILIVLLVTLALGRIAQFFIESYVSRLDKKKGENTLSLVLKCLTKPISVAVYAFGLHLARLCLVFDNPNTELVEGLRNSIETGWIRTARAVAAIAVAYGIYKLVDVVEHYLIKLTSRTHTKLDDMLVPVVRKSLRITIAIVAAIFILENILGQDVKSILLGAGVGGIAIALAAKDTIANFFGSVTIFADRPFQIDERIKIAEYDGIVEEVGFRSTRIRTLNGNLVTIPNSLITSSTIENIGKRPFIRRTSNITITYDSGPKKTARAVEIIKDVLAHTPEVTTDPDNPPRVYFSDYNDCSLNIYMSYWVKPPEWWLFQEVNERVNFEIQKRFEAEGIEFAFPTQTLYLKKE
ncbi:MAG: mechanosensitive ion channel family protein [Sedimentisphaerales bacterium]|nr:mechanosensitive ion channel family protein [Sedimentisphaerales bacterium]